LRVPVGSVANTTYSRAMAFRVAYHMNRDHMPDVFISYSADAKKLAERLANSLQEEGVATWSDFRNVSPGERLYDQMQRALDQAKFYLIVVGPRNVMRDWQDQEWQGALERTWTDPDKRIIPVLVGDAATPAFLRSWAPFRLQPGRHESAAAKKLAEIIKTCPRGEQSRRADAPLGRDWRKRIRGIESAAKQSVSSIVHMASPSASEQVGD
jgi:hypothetical protein